MKLRYKVNIKLYFVLVISFCVLVTISFVRILSAQQTGPQPTEKIIVQPVAGFGKNCTPNYGKCPPGNINLAASESLEFYGGMSMDYFVEALKNKYPNDWMNICYDPSKFSGQLITIFGVLGVDFKIGNRMAVRVCPQGLIPSKGTSEDGITAWGCCPKGYRATVRYGGTLFNPNYQDRTEISLICCRDPGPQYLIYEYYDACEYHIKNKDGSKELVLKIKNGNPKEERERVNKNIFGQNQVTDEPYGYVITHGEEVGENGPLYVQGIPIGDLINEVGVSKVDNNGSGFVCAEKSGCTLTDDKKVVLSEDLYVNKDNECRKCYSAGEIIGLEEGTSQAIVCDPDAVRSGTGGGRGGSGSSPKSPVRKLSSVANNASLTQACIYSGTNNSPNGVGGSEGYLQCKKCVEQGGVWTAIGCVDPSPLGIITGVIRIIFGVVGGIALVLLIIAGLQYMKGEEEAVKKARENLIQLFTGLVVLIFSIVILRIIGINILDVLPVGSV
ncbi:hypothetical protein D6810_01720 [Candidatus Dojkabacteria bacterium]|uniref:Uncharacterized protein n=1 Tax=Candidatus Dojkabacteria bacterium TaxID=2099670 RepID=A0A3M0YYP5_9BACT|nr:MAG: hypothetical protein D6810_01720 [Candidatus Dojkabacteria bacterium]